MTSHVEGGGPRLRVVPRTREGLAVRPASFRPAIAAISVEPGVLQHGQRPRSVPLHTRHPACYRYGRRILLI